MLLTDTNVPAAAVIRLKEALQIFPSSSKLWFALGIAHFTEHKSDEATKAFQQALTLDPKFAPALAYLGLIHREQGRSPEAVDFYERALALDEKLSVVHYLAADALLRETTPDSKRVEMHLRRAIALDPSIASSLLALGKLYSPNEKAAPLGFASLTILFDSTGRNRIEWILTSEGTFEAWSVIDGRGERLDNRKLGTKIKNPVLAVVRRQDNFLFVLNGPDSPPQDVQIGLQKTIKNMPHTFRVMLYGFGSSENNWDSLRVTTAK